MARHKHRYTQTYQLKEVTITTFLRVCACSRNIARVIQFGWTPWSTSNVTVHTVDGIHQIHSDAEEDSGLVGSDNNDYVYTPGGLSDDNNTADMSLS